jgi:hypothetical protein
LATQGVKRVEILLDGAVATVATYGLSRPDVCATLTGFANCPNVGFTGSVTATAGSHTLRIRIVDNSDATGTFPDTPIAFVVSAPSAVNVPAGSYNGTTSQRRPILIRLKAPNVIDQYGLLLQGTCQMDEVSAISASPINIINGSFSASGGAYFFNDPSQATQGTYTISGTFNPATSAFSGTFRIDMTTGTFGACTSGQITWTASSSSVP